MKKFFNNFLLNEEQKLNTLVLISVSIFNFDMFPILASDYDGETEAFYIFNKIKIWQKTYKTK